MKPLVASAIGGISPYAITLAKSLMAKPSQHISDLITPPYFLGLLILALIGAAVGFVLQETDLKKAFVLGISAPAMITSTLSQAESSGTGLSAALPDLMPTAHAQTAQLLKDVATQIAGRTVEVNLESPLPIKAEMLDAHGNVVGVNLLSNSSQFPVAASAEKIRFGVGGSQSGLYSLPVQPGEKKTFNVTVTGVRKFGFVQAWGAPPATDYQIVVKEGSL